MYLLLPANKTEQSWLKAVKRLCNMEVVSSKQTAALLQHCDSVKALAGIPGMAGYSCALAEPSDIVTCRAMEGLNACIWSANE